MNSKERVLAALKHQPVDQIPKSEIWIDALLEDLGQIDVETAHVNLGQDTIMMPTRGLQGSNAWKDGIDEWGRVWKNGMYVNGVVKDQHHLGVYSVDVSRVVECFDPVRIEQIRRNYPGHLLMYGSHLGPFMGAYMAMGFETFFFRLVEDPGYVHALLEDRTCWAIAMFKQAVQLGAELLILGDDAAHKTAPMVSPRIWKEFILPYHKRIVESVSCPVIFHSDGCLLPVIPMIIEAGFIGLHGLEPAAGMNLASLKREYGKDLVLVGNVDVGILSRDDLGAVHEDVDRCLREGSPNGGYMLSTCNSIFHGLNPESVREYFSYSKKVTEKRIEEKW